MNALFTCEFKSANTANCIHQQSITLFVYEDTFIDKNLGATIDEKIQISNRIDRREMKKV